jgi:hypothetical protein
MHMLVSAVSQEPVTAGTATISVYYWGVRVLTASDTLCTGNTPAAVSLTPPSTELGSSSRHLPAASVSTDQLAHHVPAVSAVQQSSKSPTAASWAGIGREGHRPHRSHPARRLLQVSDATCAMPAGPVQLEHAATLPSFAPRGSYSMRLQAADVLTGQELFCLDVWFRIG